MSVTPAYIITGGGPDNSLPGVPPGIDNSLPGRPPGPVDPGFGVPLPPVDPGWGRPPAWGGPIDPGWGVGRPPHVSTGPVRPTYPVDPDWGLPSPPDAFPMPPMHPGGGAGVMPPIAPGGEPGGPPVISGGPGSLPNYPMVPIAPGYPIFPMPPMAPGGSPPEIGGGPVLPPGVIWPPLPPACGQGPLLCFVWVVGVGYRWTVIDPSLSVGLPLPGGPPGHIDNTLPPTEAQPRRG